MSQLAHNGKTITTSASSWEAAITQDSTTSKYHFDVGGKYSDQDIDISITVSDTAAKATLGSTTLSASLVENTMKTTTTAGSYYITPQASATVGKYVSASPASGSKVYIQTASPGTSKSGTSVTSITPSTSAQYINIGEGYTPARYWTVNAITSAGAISTLGTWSPSSSFYTTTNTGYGVTPTNKATPSSAYYILAGSFSHGTTDNTATTGSGWVEQTENVTVEANGYLYLNAGWFPNTQISLASLIPDDTDYTNAGTGQIRSGYEAYDTNGNKLIGTISNWTPDGTYYTTTNTGYGLISQGTYVNTTAAMYIKKATSAADTASSSITAGTGDSASSSNTSISLLSTAPSSGTYYTLTAKGTGNSKITAAGWITTGSLASPSNKETLYYIAKSVITNGATLPSGTTPSDTIKQNAYIKISAGYNPTDVYYLAQGDAHSSYTPSSTYFTTTSNSYGTITANKYATSTYYVIAGSAAVTGSQTITPTIAIGTLDTTNNRYAITATGSKSITGTVSKAGWITSVSSATVSLSGGTVYVTSAGAATGALTTTTDTTTYPSGYTQVTLTSNAGYNASAVTSKLCDVYQGTYTVS